MEEKGKDEAISSSLLRLFGIISSGEWGDGNLGEENQDLKKKGSEEEYQVVGNFVVICIYLSKLFRASIIHPDDDDDDYDAR